MENENLACRKKAMSLLNHRDRTEWELRDRLSVAGFDTEEVEDAVEYVRSFHYIDDLRFATRFVEAYRERRSIRRIRQDLVNKHIPEEYIEIAFEEAQADDSSAIRREIKKRLSDKAPSELSEKERQKIAMGLYRKGFQTADIFRELDAMQ
ncbi:MAG: regulatory protein RecX [Lachnospiraceae bacterium]|nr:regulatory protein RecX [Lachnospiraceae bacterium]